MALTPLNVGIFFLAVAYKTLQNVLSIFPIPSSLAARDVGSIPELGRSPGVGNGTPLWYSCLENSMDRGAWRATVHGVTKSHTRLSEWTHMQNRALYCFPRKCIESENPAH